MWSALLFSLLSPQVSSYCNAGNTVFGDSNLGPVVLAGRQSVIRDESDCPGSVGLIDLTNLTADLGRGLNYSLYFQATTCGSGWARLAYAFIDFNNNDIYEDDELVGTQNVGNGVDPIPIVFPFMVPRNAMIGKTRMRVFVVESGFVANPCLTFAYGGVKEFSIEISDAPLPEYCNAGNTALESSNLGPVQLLGEQSAIIDTTDCPGVLGLRDLTNLWATVKAGREYTLQLDVTTCTSRAYNRYAYAFIDFNGNKKYDDGELLGSASVGSNLPPVSLRFTFNVPCLGRGSVAGTTHMRVFVVEGGRAPDPCLVFAYGGTKEFSIDILDTVEPPCTGDVLESGNVPQLEWFKTSRQ